MAQVLLASPHPSTAPSPSVHTSQSLVPKFISTCRLPYTPKPHCKTTLQRRGGSVAQQCSGGPWGLC